MSKGHKNLKRTSNESMKNSLTPDREVSIATTVIHDAQKLLMARTLKGNYRPDTNLKEQI